MKTVMADNVFLYSLWSGEFIKYKGYVQQYHFDNKVGRFTVLDTNKHLQCGLTPGVIHNAVFWLVEEDDDRAKQIMIDYKKEQINKLQLKIDKQQRDIDLLSLK